MNPIATNIFVVGSGGHGSEICSYLQLLQGTKGGVSLVGAIDDKKPKGKWNQTEILGNLTDLTQWAQNHSEQCFGYITAVGDNAIRESLIERIEALKFPNLIPFTVNVGLHPIHSTNSIGSGTLLAPGTILTTNVKIGRHCILNIKASISHDCVIGDFVNLNPGVTVAGECSIGRGAYIGAGATVLNGLTIGRGAIIGAGAVVTKNIPDFVTAVGVPARVIKELPALALARGGK